MPKLTALSGAAYGFLAYAIGVTIYDFLFPVSGLHDGFLIRPPQLWILPWLVGVTSWSAVEKDLQNVTLAFLILVLAGAVSGHFAGRYFRKREGSEVTTRWR